MGGWNVARYKQRLKAFNVPKEVEKVVKSNKVEIIGLNKSNLAKGLNSNDRIVGVYSVFTSSHAKKNPKPNKPKLPGSHYNFNWTGKFINGMFIKYTPNKISFLSKGMGLTKKTRFITKNKLLGLSDKRSISMNYKILTPGLSQAFKRHLSK